MVDLSRREFMVAGSTSILALSGDLQEQVNSDTGHHKYEFNGVADLIGPESALPGPDDPFWDNKLAHAYRYEALDTGNRYFRTHIQETWVEIMSNNDYADRKQTNSAFGQLTASHREVQAQNNFLFSLSDNDVVTSTTNSGATGISNAKAYAETGTNSGTASVNDRNRVRYRTGTEAGMLFTGGFPARDSAAQLQAGMFDANNGYYIGYDGSYFIARLNAGSETKVYQSDWDDPLDGSGPSGADHALRGLNVYRISYGYLGSAPVSFETLTDSAGWIQFHRLEFGGTGSDPHIRVPTLPPQIKATSLGSTNARVECASWMGYTLSPFKPDPQNRHWSEFGSQTANLTADTREHLITVRVKDTYQGQQNHISLKPIDAQMFGDSGEYTIVRISRDASFGTALTYSDVNTASSVSEYATDDSTVSDGRLIETFSLATQGSGNSGSPVGATGSLPSQRILPGETITIDVESPGSPNAYVGALSWEELF